jgi:hypothetical protein
LDRNGEEPKPSNSQSKETIIEKGNLTMAAEYLPFTDMEEARGALGKKEKRIVKFLLASYAKPGLKSARFLMNALTSVPT